MKPKILDEWAMMRIQQPERAYKKFFFRKYSPFINFNCLVDQKPFGYTSNHFYEFKDAGTLGMSN
jgi:hypothetical protein